MIIESWLASTILRTGQRRLEVGGLTLEISHSAAIGIARRRGPNDRATALATSLRERQEAKSAKNAKEEI